MNNKDILKKARQEKEDEREERVNMKAFHIGWLSVSVVMLFLIIFRSLHDEPASDIMMILATQLASSSFYQYFNIRDKKIYLFCGILCTVGVFLSLAALLSQYGVF